MTTSETDIIEVATQMVLQQTEILVAESDRPQVETQRLADAAVNAWIDIRASRGTPTFSGHGARVNRDAIAAIKEAHRSLGATHELDEAGTDRAVRVIQSAVLDSVFGTVPASIQARIEANDIEARETGDSSLTTEAPAPPAQPQAPTTDPTRRQKEIRHRLIDLVPGDRHVSEAGMHSWGARQSYKIDEITEAFDHFVATGELVRGTVGNDTVYAHRQAHRDNTLKHFPNDTIDITKAAWETPPAQQ